VQPNDRILDIGCGDGVLTAQIAAAASGVRVLGLDASESMIETAKRKHAAAGCDFRILDCTQLGTDADVTTGKWDKVFSNAAMHWILRQPETRSSFFRDVCSALKPGGMFVFEMGGKGNVAEVHGAMISALLANGLSMAEIKEADPWFFPSDAWMRKALEEEAGFDVLQLEIEYRPTKLTPETADKSGGLEGWLRLMGAQFIQAAPVDRMDRVVEHALRTLEGVVTREEDGSQHIGYVRLRAEAKKR